MVWSWARDHAILQDVPDGRKVMTASIMRRAGKHRRPSVAQITLTQEEAAALRGALRSYVSDRRMEIAHTDSWQWRQGLKREAVLLKKLLEQLDAELAVAGAVLIAWCPYPAMKPTR